MINRCALYYLQYNNQDYPEGIVLYLLLPGENEIKPLGFSHSPTIRQNIENWLLRFPHVCNQVSNYQKLETEIKRRLEKQNRLYEPTIIRRTTLYSNRKVS